MMRSLLAITLCGLLLSGCATFSREKEGGKLPEAELEARYAGSVTQVRKAAFQVLNDLDLEVYIARQGSDAIEGIRSDGTRVRLALEQVSNGRTAVRIKARAKGASDIVRLIESGIARKVDRPQRRRQKRVVTAAVGISQSPCNMGSYRYNFFHS